MRARLEVHEDGATVGAVAGRRQRHLLRVGFTFGTVKALADKDTMLVENDCADHGIGACSIVRGPRE
jgi:hypothetical protein